MDGYTRGKVFPMMVGAGTEKCHSKNIWAPWYNVGHQKTFKDKLKQKLAYLLCTSGRELPSEKSFSSVNCPNSLDKNYCQHSLIWKSTTFCCASHNSFGLQNNLFPLFLLLLCLPPDPFIGWCSRDSKDSGLCFPTLPLNWLKQTSSGDLKD